MSQLGFLGELCGVRHVALEEFDWEACRRRYPNIGRLDLILEADNDTNNRYKLSDQADVPMLLYLFAAEELTAIFPTPRLPLRSPPPSPRPLLLHRPLLRRLRARTGRNSRDDNRRLTVA